MPESTDQPMPRQRRRRSKIKPVPVEKLPLNPLQRQLFDHLTSWVTADVTVVHPQSGFRGEIAVIAIGLDATGEKTVLLRMDNVPPLNGVPFRIALKAAFPQFPFALYLRARKWAVQPVVPQVSASA